MTSTTPKPQATKPQAVKIERGPLSCWVTRTTPRGRWLSSSYFDVPSESYEDGYVTGARLARDLIRLIREAPAHERHQLEWAARNTMLDAAAVRTDTLDHGPSGAAVGFLRIMVGVMIGGILHLDSTGFADRLVSQAERERDLTREFEAKRQAERALKMKAARSIKARASAQTSEVTG